MQVTVPQQPQRESGDRLCFAPTTQEPPGSAASLEVQDEDTLPEDPSIQTALLQSHTENTLSPAHDYDYNLNTVGLFSFFMTVCFDINYQTRCINDTATKQHVGITVDLLVPGSWPRVRSHSNSE